MVRVLLIVATMAALLTAGGLAWAAEEEKPARPGERFLERLKAADTDGDGKLSKEEAPERMKEHFDKIDANGDGYIDMEELKQAVGAMLRKGRPGPRPKPGPGQRPGPGRRPSVEQILERLKALDKDGDGKISKEEAPERMKERFDRMDANGDGYVDMEELKKAVGEMMRKFRPGPGAKPGRGPEGKPGRRPGPGGLAERIKTLDTDGDGKLSKDEAPGRLKERFDDIDANDDGFIEVEEIRKAFQARMKKPKP